MRVKLLLSSFFFKTLNVLLKNNLNVASISDLSRFLNGNISYGHIIFKTFEQPLLQLTNI